jgi:hypothetical protein
MENSEARKRKEEANVSLTAVQALEAIEDSLTGTILVLRRIIESLEGRSNESDSKA